MNNTTKSPLYTYECTAWESDCKPFVTYGNYALGCRHMLVAASDDAAARDLARQMERVMCTKAEPLSDYLSNTLYIDTLAPREPVAELNTCDDCPEPLRTSTSRVLHASDVRTPLSVSRRQSLCHQWEEMVALALTACGEAYEEDLQRRMRDYDMGRDEALEFLALEVQEAVDANHFGPHLNHAGGDVRSLVALIRGESGSEMGDELNAIIRLAAQKKWIMNQQNAIAMEENKNTTATMAPITMNFNAPAQVLPNATQASQTFVYGDEAAREHFRSCRPPMDEREARMAIYVADGEQRGAFILKLNQSQSTSDVALCVKALVAERVVDKAVAYSEGFAQAIMLYYTKVKQPRAIQDVIKKII